MGDCASLSVAFGKAYAFGKTFGNENIATVKVESRPPVKTTMTTCREWIAIGKSLDLTGKELLEFALTQQNIAREVRQRERDERQQEREKKTENR